MKSLLTRLRAHLSTVNYNRAALIESGKLFFALVGVGTVLANVSIMRVWQLPIAVLLVGGVWFAIYLQMEGVQQ